jgi:RND family efflux transporter MFP subunit
MLTASLAHAQEPAKPIPLDTREQAALGVRFAPLEPAKMNALLLTAVVTTPPGREVIVSAPYAGQVSRLAVGLGDKVRSGAELGAFTSPQLAEARRLLNEARIEQRTASAQLDRDSALLAEGIIPAARMQLSRARNESAQALVQSRAAELRASGMRVDDAWTMTNPSSSTLRAPITGVVSEALTGIGQRVEAGAVLFRLLDTSQLQLDIKLSGSKATQLQPGDEIDIPERGAKARIIAINRTLDTSQSASARAQVYLRGELQIGEILTVSAMPKITAGPASVSPGWQVPSRGLSQWRGAPVIFLQTAKGVAARKVRILSSNDDIAVIDLLVEPGSKIAISGVASLRALLQKDE